MNSRTAQALQKRIIGQIAEQRLGRQSSVGRMGAERAFGGLVSLSYSLPVDAEELAIQNGDGDFLFLEGYSDPDGPDVTP